MTTALASQDWDDSIKALVAVPNVLSMMNEQLDWTTKLGDTVLAQQADVMDAIQRLRLKAQANGKLESTEQQKVSVSEPEGSAQPVVVIEQASPETVYVPYYDPAVVYGPWPYPDYQPYYFRPGPGWVVGGAIATGLAWSAGFAIGNAIWGDGFDWRHNDIHVNVNRNVNINNKNVNVTNWQHNSVHRRGVSYNNTQVKNKFANANIKSGDKKLDFRGRGGEQVIKPGAGGKPDLGGKLPGQGGLADKKPDLGGKGPGQGNLANKKPDLGGKGPGQGNLANKKPDLGGKGPGQGNLANKKPDLGGKKPNLGGGAGGAKPRPGGGAFDVSDGAKAKDFSKRGHASLGDRGPNNFKKPAGKPKSLGKPGGGAKAKSIGKPGAVTESRVAVAGAEAAALGNHGRDRSKDTAMREDLLAVRKSVWLLLGAVFLGLCSPASAQEHFKTPDEAVTALVDAAKAGDRKAIVKVLGPGGREIVSSGDPVADAATRDKFVASYDQKHSLVPDGTDKTVLVIGSDDFPFPIPLVSKDGEWQFDTAAGREEILSRRIGRNELSAIQVALAYVQAQNEYASLDPAGLGPHAYAQRIVSSPGKKDGLYWPSAEGEQQSPLGALAAQASGEGYKVGKKPIPYHGYFYRILKRQGNERRRGRLRLCRQGQDDRRVRTDRLSRAIRKFGDHDLHGQP